MANSGSAARIHPGFLDLVNLVASTPGRLSDTLTASGGFFGTPAAVGMRLGVRAESKPLKKRVVDKRQISQPRDFR